MPTLLWNLKLMSNYNPSGLTWGERSYKYPLAIPTFATDSKVD